MRSGLLLAVGSVKLALIGSLRCIMETGVHRRQNCDVVSQDPARCCYTGIAPDRTYEMGCLKDTDCLQNIRAKNVEHREHCAFNRASPPRPHICVCDSYDFCNAIPPSSKSNLVSPKKTLLALLCVQILFYLLL